MKNFFIVVSLIIFPFYSNAIEIGVNVHPNQFPGSSDEIIKILEKNNINSFRTDYSWGQLEKKPGVYVAINNNLNEIINQSKARNIKALLILDYGNSIYNIDRPLSNDQIKKYVEYVNWVSLHFKNKIYAYEIWNEWAHKDKLDDLTQMNNSAESYVRLVSEASKVIKKNDPGVKIIAGGYNPTSANDRAWSDSIVSKGVLKYIDGVSVHPYDYSLSGLKKIDKRSTIELLDHQHIKWKKETGIDTKFYITEFGYSNYSGKYHYSQQEVKETLSNYIEDVKKYPFIAGVWYYELIDKNGDMNNIESNYGLIKSSKVPKEQLNSFINK